MQRFSIQVIAIGVGLAMVLASCGSSSDDTQEPADATQEPADATQEPADATQEPVILDSITPGSISDEWVIFDEETCGFVETSDHPTEWVAELRSTPGLKIAFGAQGATVAQQILTNDGVRDVASAAGIELVFGDYNYPSTTDPIDESKAMALQKPAGIISYLVLSTLLEPVNAAYEEICAPIVQITVPYKNSPTFGLSNQDDGRLMGTFLGEAASERGWSGSDTTILVNRNDAFGLDVTDRMTQCAAAALEALPGADVQYLDVGSDTQAVQVATIDWLTAHPDADQVAGCGFADTFALGMANAFDSTGRSDEAIIVGTGGSEDALAAIRAGSPFAGTVNQHYEDYGRYTIPLIQDILDGKPVPAKIHQQLHMIDASNATD